MAELCPGVKLSVSTEEAMKRIATASATTETVRRQQDLQDVRRSKNISPPVTLDTVGDYYFTNALARNAVKAGITQQEFIGLLLKECTDLQEALIKTLKEQPPQYYGIKPANDIN